MAKRWMTERELAATKVGRAALAKEKRTTKPRVPTKRGPSAIEESMAAQIKEAGLPAPVREHQPIEGRKFRMDFAWPDLKIGIEVQGMTHRIKGKFHRDIEKRVLATLARWTVLEVDGASVRSGQALAWLLQLFDQRGLMRVVDAEYPEVGERAQPS